MKSEQSEGSRGEKSNQTGSMSFMRGDVLSKTRKLVKGLATAEPIWLKAMEHAPPATFPRAPEKVQKISLPEDAYITKFYKKHTDSKIDDPIKICAFDPPPSRVFAKRVLEMKRQGVDEAQAISVADMEYRAEKNAKKKAYGRLRKIAWQLREKQPPNPYPSAIREIVAETNTLYHDRYNDPQLIELGERMTEEKAALAQDSYGGGW